MNPDPLYKKLKRKPPVITIRFSTFIGQDTQQELEDALVEVLEKWGYSGELINSGTGDECVFETSRMRDYEGIYFSNKEQRRGQFSIKAHNQKEAIEKMEIKGDVVSISEV